MSNVRPTLKKACENMSEFLDIFYAWLDFQSFRWCFFWIMKNCSFAHCGGRKVDKGFEFHKFFSKRNQTKKIWRRLCCARKFLIKIQERFILNELLLAQCEKKCYRVSLNFQRNTFMQNIFKLDWVENFSIIFILFKLLGTLIKNSIYISRLLS